ncbi:MAG: hypothetical protein P4L65_09570 [Legionella sp.]|nr:hypothetical protein [Legionella sp.]
MNKDRWRTFHSHHSPAVVTVNTVNPSTLDDWRRLNWDKSLINGKTVQSYMDEAGMIQADLSEQELKDFLKKIVLAEVPERNKSFALDYLMNSFHQGGLLHPVSTAMSHLFNDKGTGITPSTNRNSREVNIVTNESGFTIQEITTAKQFYRTDEASEKLKKKYPDSIILPDKGNDFCLQAEATINVSFAENKSSFEVLHQSISYGNSDIKDLADTRNWFTKFKDFIKNLFNSNSVLDLSSVKKENNPSTAPNLEQPDKSESPPMTEIAEPEHESGLKLS